MKNTQVRQSVPNQFAVLSAWSLVTMLGSGAIWVGWMYRLPHPLCVLLGHVVAAVAAKMFLGRRAAYVYIGILASLACWLCDPLPEFARAILCIGILVLMLVAYINVSERIPAMLFGGWTVVVGTLLQMANAGLAEDPTVWAKAAFYIAFSMHAVTVIVFTYYRRLQKKSTSSPDLPAADAGFVDK